MIQAVEPACRQAECYFLENFQAKEVSDSLAHEFGKIIFWKDYTDGFQLLEKIKPDKLIFQLIDNYYHFALLFAARQITSIQIWYIDHGIRFEHELDNMDESHPTKFISFLKRFAGGKILNFASYIKNGFFRKTKTKLPKFKQTDFQKVFNARSVNTFGMFMRSCGHLLRPDGFIVYSPETFSFYKILFQLDLDFEKNHPVIYVGIPSLDHLYWVRDFEPQENANSFLLIDQALHEQSILGWTEIKKIDFLVNLINNLHSYGMTLIIKPHPWNDNYYKKIRNTKNLNFDIIYEINKDNIQNVAMVASFNSTLLLAFCAGKFKVFCFELHPESVKPEFSYGICKYGVAQALYNFIELNNFLKENRIDTTTDFLSKQEKFINEVLYKFDDKSKSRFNEAILLNEFY